MEITIIDTAETAQQKLKLLNKRQTSFIRFFSLIPIIFGPISLIIGLSSDYSNHSSIDGHHTYINLNIGIGLGIAFIITGGYLELQLFRIRKKLQSFRCSIITYTFDDSAIKTTSAESECIIKWEAIQSITPMKSGVLVSTNNYSCPTIFLLNSQISNSEIDWIASQIRKK